MKTYTVEHNLSPSPLYPNLYESYGTYQVLEDAVQGMVNLENLSMRGMRVIDSFGEVVAMGKGSFED